MTNSVIHHALFFYYLIKKHVFPAVFIITFIIVFFTGCYRPPKPVNGVLSLKQFPEDRVIELYGSWEYYYCRLYRGSDFDTHEAKLCRKYRDYHGSPLSTFIDGLAPPEKKYSTSRMRIFLPETTGRLFIRIPATDVAINVYCNGRLIFSNGIVGTTPESSGTVFYHHYIGEVYPEHGMLELVVHSSNFHFPRSMLNGIVAIGYPESLIRFHHISVSIEMIAIGSLLVMFIYNFMLFLVMKNDRRCLYLSIVCLATTFHTVASAGITGIRWDSIVMIRYYSWITAVYFYYRFFTTFYPGYQNRFISAAFVFLTLVICCIITFEPFTVYNYMYYPVSFLYFFSILYYFAVSLVEFSRKGENSLLMLFSFIIIFFFMFFDRLSGIYINQFNIVSPAEIVYFCIIQSVLTGRSINRQYVDNLELSQSLKSSNSELTALTLHIESVVARKTDELRSVNLEIRTQNRIMQEMNSSLESRINDTIEELRQKDDILIINSRQATLGAILSFIGHQWKQNLYAIQLHSESLKLLSEGPSFNKDRIVENIDIINRLILDMYGVLQDFTDFIRPGREPKRFLITEVLEETISLINDLLRLNSIELVREYIEDCIITGHPSELKQVFVNLIINSLDAFKERDCSERKITVSVCRSDDMAHVTVGDNAGGILSGNIETVFEKFNTSKNNGDGLGLYISMIIIRQRFGGDIKVVNNNGGAEFTILIPCHRDWEG